jgi:hypothetical protein
MGPMVRTGMERPEHGGGPRMGVSGSCTGGGNGRFVPERRSFRLPVSLGSAGSSGRLLILLLFLPLFLFSPPAIPPLGGQDAEPPPSRFLLSVGLAGGPGSAHGFAGGQLALGGQRFGVVGHGAYGSGNQFTSLLVGVGPAARLAFPAARTGIPLEVRVFGGWGRYGESLAVTSPLSGAGESRGAWGPQAGATLLTPMGPVRVGGGAVAWGGRYRSEALEKGVPARGWRFVLLLGR